MYNVLGVTEQSPASAESALTVGATDQGDNFASYSNYGVCVDINAPGTSVLSTYIGEKRGENSSYTVVLWKMMM